MINAENMNETEVPLSQGKSSRPWLILSLLIMIVAITVLSLISDSWRDNRSISYVRVYGTVMSNSDDIADLVKDSVEGKYIKSIDISEILNIIRSNRFVADVRVNPLFNGEFQIFVTERVPIALSVNSENKLVFIDSKGYVFPFVQDSTIFDYPVVRGIIGTASFVTTAYVLNKIMIDCPEYLQIVSEIMPGRGHNTYEIISSDYGYRIIIDGQTNLAEQLKKYYVFLSSSICANDKIKIDYLDLRWEKRLVIGKLA
jgi:cell division septal protein FtsQ